MAATIIARTPTSFTLQVEVPYNDSMLDFEEALQERLNEAGVVATAEGAQAVRHRRLADHRRPGQVHQQGSGREGLPDPLRRRHRRPPRLPEQPGRSDLLPARPGRPDRRQFHPPVRQGPLAQVRRVQFAPGPGRPGGEPRPVGLPLPDPGRGRCGGGGGAGQGGGLGLRPAEVRGAPEHGGGEPGRDLPADGRGRVAGDDGRHARASTTRRASGSTPSTWRRRRSTARRSSWATWRRRSAGPRRSARRPTTWGSPTGRRGTGSSSGGTPTCR